MSRHATFENFGMAFLTLFQVSTGDNWNGIMKVTELRWEDVARGTYGDTGVVFKVLEEKEQKKRRGWEKLLLCFSLPVFHCYDACWWKVNSACSAAPGTDFPTDWQGSSCISLHTHTLTHTHSRNTNFSWTLIYYHQWLLALACSPWLRGEWR